MLDLGKYNIKTFTDRECELLIPVLAEVRELRERVAYNGHLKNCWNAKSECVCGKEEIVVMLRLEAADGE